MSIHYDPFSGAIEKKSFDTINVKSGKIDWPLIRKQFYILWIIPEALTDSNYRNETVTNWQNEMAKKDYNNSSYFYYYDSLSLLKHYSHSGFNSGISPFAYSIRYNLSGQPLEISNAINDKNSYYFEYNSKGNITQIDYYTFGKLSDRIILIK